MAADKRKKQVFFCGFPKEIHKFIHRMVRACYPILALVFSSKNNAQGWGNGNPETIGDKAQKWVAPPGLGAACLGAWAPGAAAAG